MSDKAVDVIGLGRNPNFPMEERIYTANSKLEMYWRTLDAKREGWPIYGWYAQTKKGCRLIGAQTTWEIVPAEFVSFKRLNIVTCPICGGKGCREVGQDNDGHPILNCCPVCQGTGKTRKGYWDEWQDWQLEKIKKEMGVTE